jgi:hypothetical protein
MTTFEYLTTKKAVSTQLKQPLLFMLYFIINVVRPWQLISQRDKLHFLISYEFH